MPHMFTSMPSSVPSFVEGFLAPLAIDQLFHELHALEIQDRRTLLLASVKRHADLPRASEHLGVLNSGLIRNHIGPNTNGTLHHVQRIPVKIAPPVKP